MQKLLSDGSLKRRKDPLLSVSNPLFCVLLGCSHQQALLLTWEGIRALELTVFSFHSCSQNSSIVQRGQPWCHQNRWSQRCVCAGFVGVRRECLFALTVTCTMGLKLWASQNSKINSLISNFVWRNETCQWGDKVGMFRKEVRICHGQQFSHRDTHSNHWPDISVPVFYVYFFCLVHCYRFIRISSEKYWAD